MPADELLQRRSADADASWYAVEGERASAIERYVLSTPYSREVCNRPELIGVEYTTALERAMTAGLKTAPFRALIADHPQAQLVDTHAPRWKGVEPALMDRMFAAQEAFWAGMSETDPRALRELARARIRGLSGDAGVT